MKQMDFNTWSDIVQDINDKNPTKNTFSQSDYETDNITVTHYFHNGVLFSINIYNQTGVSYLINPIFLP
jgi:hypothetical protein